MAPLLEAALSFAAAAIVNTLLVLNYTVLPLFVAASTNYPILWMVPQMSPAPRIKSSSDDVWRDKRCARELPGMYPVDDQRLRIEARTN